MVPSSTAVDEVRAEQLACWERGDPVRLEALLETRPELREDAEALLDLIYAEVLLREEHGDRPELAQYLHSFPHLAEPLRRLFAAHDALLSLETDACPVMDGATTIDDRASCAKQRMDVGPQRSGPYEALEEIGRGGMGIVYRARHRVTGRLAALKVMQAGLAPEEESAKFLVEARAVAALSHPNIVQIYEVVTPPPGEGVPFIALEYVAGGNLAAHINGTPLPPREAAALVRALAEAMAHAHQAGIAHRDLKPANVLLSGSGGDPLRGCPAPRDGSTPGADATGLIPKITDFGLARLLDAHSGQTRTGNVLGTPSYMAPEQAEGKREVGPAADVYALGAILYECLTGRPPFKGATVLDTLDQVRTREPVAPRRLNPAVPLDLETICLKCLRKEPARRFATCRDLAADLARHLNGEPIRSRPTGVPERALKWVKRRPAVSALLGATGVAVAALVVVWVTFTIRLEEQRRQAVWHRELAEGQAREAKSQGEEARRQSERAGHLLSLAATAVDEIAVSARVSGEGRSGSTGAVLFKLACFYARASRTLGQDEILPAADRRRLAEQYAVSAVRLLNCAERVGFFDRARQENREALEKSTDLAILRERADYRTWRLRLR
jgi:serine/threonine protein kinase